MELTTEDKKMQSPTSQKAPYPALRGDLSLSAYLDVLLVAFV